MKKNLLTLGVLAISLSFHAQNILMHVDTAAKMYVSQGTLVYNGGGLQMKGAGNVENHGNFMVVGSATDSFKTVDGTTNLDKTEAAGGANFVNKLNQPGNFANNNTAITILDETKKYTYGQLFISGIPQSNITGIVDQEYRQINQGDYQQMGIPFYNKTYSTLSSELGKTFNTTRYSKNEILSYDNIAAVSKTATDLNSKFGISLPATAYLMVGGLGLNANTQTRTIKGRPFSDNDTNVSLSFNLSNAGTGANFGPGGYGVNQYNEYYNSYLHDPYEIGSGGQYWINNFGKNIYQFSNPFLTNIDLSRIAYDEPVGTGGITDGNNLSNIYAVRLEPSGVQYTGFTGSGATGTFKSITFNAGVPTGDVDYTMVRPFGTFVIKLNNNTTAPLFNLRTLRRFNYLSRAEGVSYGVTASKNTNTGTVKQLGVIALDDNGNEVGRTYYVVYPNGTTGHSSNSKTQITGYSTDVINTYEEAPGGGYDLNYTNSYWLYINEANEANFLGKNIKLVNYDLNRAKSYKFEVREDAELVANGTHQLSTGIGFYYKAQNGSLQPINQGATTTVTHAEYDLYYGAPNAAVLNTVDSSVKPSRTIVVYNPEITNYIVRFDPSWKKADIQVFDMSGKLVISKKDVTATKDFVIELDGAIRNSYLVTIKADNGEIVNTKIIK
jgi:hypothetical protein